MTEPAGDALYLAVHEMLVVRLLQGQASPEFLTAINRLIDIHDEMAEERDVSEPHVCGCEWHGGDGPVGAPDVECLYHGNIRRERDWLREEIERWQTCWDESVYDDTRLVSEVMHFDPHGTPATKVAQTENRGGEST